MIDKNKIINNLAEALKPLPFIYAFWLEGADATNTADEYSDIDFWVDFEDVYEAEAIEAVENALSEISEIDYKYIMRHSHPKIRQRVYHLAGTSKYLMLDFCWQLHSRPNDEYSYHENDSVEAAKIIFDKQNLLQIKPPRIWEFSEENKQQFEEARYRRTQHCRAEKYVHRKQYLEAYAYYNRYVLEPIIILLRLIHTPIYTDYYLVHISQHIPQAERIKLEYFAKIASLDDISEKISLAGKWFDELAQVLQDKRSNNGS